jgi:hypothetical protein
MQTAVLLSTFVSISFSLLPSNFTITHLSSKRYFGLAPLLHHPQAHMHRTLSLSGSRFERFALPAIFASAQFVKVADSQFLHFLSSAAVFESAAPTIADREISSGQVITESVTFLRCKFTGRFGGYPIEVRSAINISIEFCSVLEAQLRSAFLYPTKPANVSFSDILFFGCSMSEILKSDTPVLCVSMYRLNLSAVDSAASPIGLRTTETATLHDVVITAVTFHASIMKCFLSEPLSIDSMRIYTCTPKSQYNCDLSIQPIDHTTSFSSVVNKVHFGGHVGIDRENPGASVYHIVFHPNNDQTSLDITNCCFYYPEDHWVSATNGKTSMTGIRVSEDCCNQNPLRVPYGVIADEKTDLRIAFYLRERFEK